MVDKNMLDFQQKIFDALWKVLLEESSKDDVPGKDKILAVLAALVQLISRSIFSIVPLTGDADSQDFQKRRMQYVDFFCNAVKESLDFCYQNLKEREVN